MGTRTVFEDVNGCSDSQQYDDTLDTRSQSSLVQWGMADLVAPVDLTRINSS